MSLILWGLLWASSWTLFIDLFFEHSMVARELDIGVICLPKKGWLVQDTARVFGWFCPAGWVQRRQYVLSRGSCFGGALRCLGLKYWIRDEKVQVSGLPLTTAWVLLHGLLNCKCWGNCLDKAEGQQGGICSLVRWLGVRSHQWTHRTYQNQHSNLKG